MLISLVAKSQTAGISGVVKGTDGEPIERVTIGIKEEPRIFTNSDEKGAYSLEVPAGRTLTIIFYDISYGSTSHTFTAKENEQVQFSPVLRFRNELTEVEITDFKKRSEEI